MEGPTGEPSSLSARELTALALSVALVPLNSTMLAVAIPGIAHDLGVPGEELTQALVAAYLLVGIVLQSPGGKLGDGLGYGRTLALGQLVFAVGAVVGFFARSVGLLELSRAAMAAGGAVMTPAAFALVRVRTPPHAQARAFGAFGALMAMSAALGPVLGGEIVARAGWPWLFAVNAPPVVVAALLGRGGTREPARPLPRFDVLGSVLLAAGLGALVAGVRWMGPAVAAAGAAVLALFVLWERRAADPVVDPSLFRVRAFSAGVSLIGLQNLAMYALLFELPIVLSRAFGAGPRESGYVLLPMTAAMSAGAIAGGRLAARFGERRCAVAGSVSAIAGMGWLAVGPLASAADFVPGMLVLGVGIGVSTPAAQAATMGAVDRARSGMAAGVSTTFRYLGGVIGVGAVSALLHGGDPLAAHRAAARLLTVAAALALGCAALLTRPARTAAPAPAVAAKPA